MRLPLGSSSDLAAWRIGIGLIGVALSAIATALTQLLGASSVLRLASAVLLAICAVAGAVLFLLERQIQRRDQLAEQLEGLKESPQKERPLRLGELSPYDLGTDREALTLRATSGGAQEYIPRDQDHRLRELLRDASSSDSLEMIVVRGPSKAGKSRTLFEAARSDEGLAESFVVAPRSVAALAHFVESSAVLEIPPGPVLLWLDDLERFATDERGGMCSEMLDEISSWPRKVIVTATAGGRAAERAEDKVLIPLDRLYDDPRIRVIGLSSELSTAEQKWIRERYAADAAKALATHGIGEHLVAAGALSRKLQEERHQPGEPSSPEGAALVWAAIDWARAGMQRPITQELLRKLWEAYQRGWKPSDERFGRALEWARRPIHRTVALLEEEGDGFRAYDWITAHVDRDRVREPNNTAWEMIFAIASPQERAAMGRAALDRNQFDHAERAFTQGISSSDDGAQAMSWFELGVTLQIQGDLKAAKAAFKSTLDAEHPVWSPRAMISLGDLDSLENDYSGATAWYQRASRSNDPDEALVAKIRLAEAAQGNGDLERAVAELHDVINSGSPQHAQEAEIALAEILDGLKKPQAAVELLEPVSAAGHPNNSPAADLALGKIFARNRKPEKAEAAFKRAMNSGHPYIGPQAAVEFGKYRASRGDLDGAREVYRMAVASGHPLFAPGAALNIGATFANEGNIKEAEKAFSRASESRQRDIAASGFMNLAALYFNAGERPKAIAAYRRASESGDPDLAPQAALELGDMLAENSDEPGARAAYQKAIDSRHKRVAIEAESAMRRLSLQRR